jgi:hypothetical protein
MAEKQYKYTTTIKQPQTVANVELDPKGGDLSEREYKALKRDAYGASLLEKGSLAVEEAPGSKTAPKGNAGDKSNAKKGNAKDNAVHDFDAAGAGSP